MDTRDLSTLDSSSADDVALVTEATSSSSSDAEDSSSSVLSSAEAIERSFEAGGRVCTLRRPLDRTLLDDKVLKALKKQEERKERATARKKEARMFVVCYIPPPLGLAIPN